MKLQYSAQKRKRINYNFNGFMTFESGWWFNYNTNKWDYNPKADKQGFNSHQDCRTMKAFRRKLKHAHKGIKFVLVSKWIGYDIVGAGSLSKQQKRELLEKSQMFESLTFKQIRALIWWEWFKPKKINKFYEMLQMGKAARFAFEDAQRCC